jgi:DNA polymerase-3 subunit alpha
MQYLDGIVNVKQGLMKPTYIADGLEEILSNTYGYPIFQEQVMQIFNKVADFTMGEADIIRKAMGKKKLAVLTDPKTNYKGKFIEGLIKHGASDEAAEGFWEELLDFASYAFNLSHAAAYGTLSYITAWLKYHYPAEYMSSVLAYTTYKKLPKLVNNCRTMGITMLPPNINESLNSFVAKDNKIIFGFSDIKGVGNSGVNIIKEREEHGNFVSVKNYVTRMVPLGYDKKVTESLIKAGAFDDFCDGNRATLLDSIEDLADKTKKLFDKKESLKERQEVLSELQKNGSSASEIKKAERAVASAEKAVTRWQEAYDSHSFITVKEDLELKLNAEKELLGFYFSGNPLSVYSQSINKIPNRYDIVNLDDMVENTKVTVCGLVKNYEEKQRKSDGQKFCFFTLLDESGEIQAKCFTNAFAMIGEAIKEDAAITVTGKLKRDSFNLQQDDDVKFFLNVEAVKPLQRNEAECSIIISGENPMDFIEWKQKLKEYESPVGYEAFWADELDGRLRSFHYLVSKDILKAEIPGLFIRMRKK